VRRATERPEEGAPRPLDDFRLERSSDEASQHQEYSRDKSHFPTQRQLADKLRRSTQLQAFGGLSYSVLSIDRLWCVRRRRSMAVREYSNQRINRRVWHDRSGSGLWIYCFHAQHAISKKLLEQGYVRIDAQSTVGAIPVAADASHVSPKFQRFDIPKNTHPGRVILLVLASFFLLVLLFSGHKSKSASVQSTTTTQASATPDSSAAVAAIPTITPVQEFAWPTPTPAAKHANTPSPPRGRSHGVSSRGVSRLLMTFALRSSEFERVGSWFAESPEPPNCCWASGTRTQ
jgi:hypothetical protein